jgi:diadenosine tetraphosphate (Ap4A) HIT family hydrolase
MPIDAKLPYDEANIFAKILRGEIPCKKVYEDDFALAFHDIAPRRRSMCWLSPRAPMSPGTIFPPMPPTR